MHIKLSDERILLYQLRTCVLLLEGFIFQKEDFALPTLGKASAYVLTTKDLLQSSGGFGLLRKLPESPGRHDSLLAQDLLKSWRALEPATSWVSASRALDCCSILLRVKGSVAARVPQVEVILVQRELIVFQDPTLPTRAAEGLHPALRSYNLVRSLLRGNAGDCPANVNDVRVGAVPPDGLAVDPPYVSGPTIVVCVGEPAGFAVTFGDEGAVLYAWQEVVALLEGVDADLVLLRYGLEGSYQALVYDSVSQVPYRLWRGLEVAGLQELPYPAARSFGGPFAARHARS